ncbi:MAG: hypothetical protein M1832_002102 [Thelocarpon impressellum]|nr:MAG: hypothetical protein M1832_002102 [Thelocarpon impressellum]
MPPNPATGSRKPSLFDTLDARPISTRELEESKAFVDSLNDYSSDSSLTDIVSSDFEDIEIGRPSKRRKVEEPVGEDDEDEDVDWEDAVPQATSTPVTLTAEPSGDLELTLDETTRASLTTSLGKKKGPSKIERHIRIQTHCMHVQSLLFHNLLRNVWACDREVQRILVSRLTTNVKDAWHKWRKISGLAEQGESSGTGKNRSGKGKRGKGPAKSRNERDWGERATQLEDDERTGQQTDPLIRLLKTVSVYWRHTFSIDKPGLRKKGYKPLHLLEEDIASFTEDPELSEVHGERVVDLEEFRRLANGAQGSRDVGAQLFTALLRGMGFEARLVTSLQPVGFGWGKGEEASIRKTKGGRRHEPIPKGFNGEVAEYPEDSNEIIGQDRVTGETKPPNSRSIIPRNVVRRMSNAGGVSSKPIAISDDENRIDVDYQDGSDDGSVIDITPVKHASNSRKSHDSDLPRPVYWTEVLSPVTNRFVSVDPLVMNMIATDQENQASFQHGGGQAGRAKQVLAYVVAYSADGTAKDVTVRYLRRRMWPGKTKGVRMPIERVPVYNHRGKIKRHEEFDWFKSILSAYATSSSERTIVDDMEEEELTAVKPAKKAKASEDTLQGYKTSAEFVLERHLRREEALLPSAKHVRMFTVGKGDKATEEKVFKRDDVVACKSSESWHKEGREVKAGEHPLKLVPIRAVTLVRKREIEIAEAEVGEKPKQGLYSREQTDWIIPPPIEDGIIPKNSYGNIDCFVPSMVPEGAVHLPYRSLVKVCRRLNVDHAEAVVGFEFGAQRAVPVISGVVVAEENEQMVIEGWQADEEERKKKEEGKREKAALAMWRKLLMGMRIMERVRNEYGGEAEGHVPDEVNPFTNRKKGKVKRIKGSRGDVDKIPQQEHCDGEQQEHSMGFLPDAHGPDDLGGGGFFHLGHEEGEGRGYDDLVVEKDRLAINSTKARPTAGDAETDGSRACTLDHPDTSSSVHGDVGKYEIDVVRKPRPPRGTRRGTEKTEIRPVEAPPKRKRTVVNSTPLQEISSSFVPPGIDGEKDRGDSLYEGGDDRGPNGKSRRPPAHSSEMEGRSHYFEHQDDEAAVEGEDQVSVPQPLRRAARGKATGKKTARSKSRSKRTTT